MRIEVPPAAMSEVLANLGKKARYSYLVFGNNETMAWKVAMSLGNSFPDLDVIRIEDRGSASQWPGAANSAAMFFSNCGTPMRDLTKTEAEDREATRKIIREVKKLDCPK